MTAIQNPDQNINELFEKLYVKNAPSWALERDPDGPYKYHATQSAFLLFEQQQAEINELKAKASAVPEGFVLVNTKDLLDIVLKVNEVDLLTFNNRPSAVSNCMVTIANKVQSMLKADKFSMCDINEYLKKYSDGDVLLVSDRDKFSSTLPSGVKAHWINHTRDWSFSDLEPHLGAVKFIHEIFIDKAFIDQEGEDSASNYIGFLIKEFKCSATVKRTKITLDDGIFVEVDHAH